MLPFDPRELVRSGGLTLAARTVVEGLLAGRHPGVIRAFEPLRPGGGSAVAGVWHQIASRHLKHRGRVVLLSDGFDESKHLLHALRDLRKRGHEVLFFHVLAPEEIDFPFDRPAVFRNLERPGEAVRGDARLRAEYLRNFTAYREALERGTSELHVEY